MVFSFITFTKILTSKLISLKYNIVFCEKLPISSPDPNVIKQTKERFANLQTKFDFSTRWKQASVSLCLRLCIVRDCLVIATGVISKRLI